MELEGWTLGALDRRPSLEVGGQHHGRHGAHCAVRTRAEEHPPGTALRMLGRRQRRYPSLQALVTSTHQWKLDDRRRSPFVLLTARRRPTTKSRHPTSSPNLEAHVVWRPIVTGPAWRSVLRARFVMAFL
jgi:hypothetical protein